MVYDPLEMAIATEELSTAYIGLTDEQRSMSEVCEVIENLHTSLEFISKFGQTGVDVLNASESVAALLQSIDGSTIVNVDTAKEGFTEAAKLAWNKFVEIVKKIWTWIKTVIHNFLVMVTGVRKHNQEFLTFLAQVDSKEFVRVMQNAKAASTEAIAIAEAFANRNIVSYDCALKLVKEAAFVTRFPTASFKADLEEYIQLINDHPEKIAEVVKKIEEEMTHIDAEIEQCRSEFNKYLEQGSEEGKNASDYLSIGWDTDEKVRRFMNLWDATHTTLEKELSALDACKPTFDKMVITATGKLDPNGEYFAAGSKLLQMTSQLYAKETKELATEGANITMVLVKCREALRRAFDK